MFFGWTQFDTQLSVKQQQQKNPKPWARYEKTWLPTLLPPIWVPQAHPLSSRCFDSTLCLLYRCQENKVKLCFKKSIFCTESISTSARDYYEFIPDCVDFSLTS